MKNFSFVKKSAPNFPGSRPTAPPPGGNAPLPDRGPPPMDRPPYIPPDAPTIPGVPPHGPTHDTEPDFEENLLKPRVPGAPPGGLPIGPEEDIIPTDVVVDAESGEVRIEKGRVRLKIAQGKFSPGDRVILDDSIVDAEVIAPPDFMNRYPGSNLARFAWEEGEIVDVRNEYGELYYEVDVMDGMLVLLAPEYSLLFNRSYDDQSEINTLDDIWKESPNKGQTEIDDIRQKEIDDQKQREIDDLNDLWKSSKYDKSNPPSKIKHLSPHAKEIWISAYNNAIGEYDGDEGKAHATAWSAVSKAGYETKKKDKESSRKQADWVGPEGEFADWMRGNLPQIEDTPEVYYDTHDDPFSAARNRVRPPIFEVVATVPEGRNAKSLAYTLEVYSGYSTEISGNDITIKNVQNAPGLMAELAWYGIDSEVRGENLPDLYKGMKVAVKKDIPQYNYYSGYSHPVTAVLVDYDSRDKEFILKNRWGYFRAKGGEFERVG